jgi:hypothetical protein
MFDHTSRYSRIEMATHKTPDGRTITYVRRRFLPQGERLPLLVEVTVTDGDRLDLITGRTLGDPEQFWRVADANHAMNPFDLTQEPGAIVRVPIPQVET